MKDIHFKDDLNQLNEDLLEYQKEQEEIKEIIKRIGGTKESQYRIVSTLFVVIIAVILFAGIVFKKISPIAAMLVAILIAIIKVIWMLYEAQKSMHFQFWILNSLETRINEIDKNIRKLKKVGFRHMESESLFRFTVEESSVAINFSSWSEGERFCGGTKKLY